MSQSRRLALIGLVTVALAGCNLAPEYRQPTMPVADQFPDQPLLDYQQQSGELTVQNVAASALAGELGSAADIAWQQFFEDPALKALIALALEDNRDLQQAVARMDQAQAAWGVQRGALYPTLGANLSGSRQRAPLVSGTSPTITSQYNAGIAVTAFELDLFGRLRNLSESAFQQYLATREGARSVQITLVADVAIQYYRWRMTQVLKALTEQTLESRQRSFRLVQARFGRGVANQIEVAQSRSLVDAAAAALARYTRDEQVARNAMAVLIGQPIPDDLPQGLPIERLAQVQAIPAGLPSALLERRPDILAATNQLLAANANIGAARAAFFPTISLTGSFGRVSTSLDGVFSSGGTGWALTPRSPHHYLRAARCRLDLNKPRRCSAKRWPPTNKAFSRRFAKWPMPCPARQRLAPSLLRVNRKPLQPKGFLSLVRHVFSGGWTAFSTCKSPRSVFSGTPASGARGL